MKQLYWTNTNCTNVQNENGQNKIKPKFNRIEQIATKIIHQSHFKKSTFYK